MLWSQAFPQAVLELQAEPLPRSVESPANAIDADAHGETRGTRPFALSALWAWACPSHLNEMRCLHPNSSSRHSYAGSERLVAGLQRVNRRLRHYGHGGHSR